MAYQNNAFAALPMDQITQQQDWEITVEFEAAVTAYTYEAELRSGPDSTAPVEITIDTTHGGTAPYSITLSLDHTQTDDLSPGVYVWDLWELDSVADTQTPIAFGQINVNAAITQVTP